MKNILIIGATSAIAKQTARLYAENSCNFYLVARNEERTELLKKDLIARGADSVETFTTDLREKPDYESIIQTAFQTLTTVDLALIAHGTLPDQKQCQASIEKTIEALEINAISTIAFLTAIANGMETQGKGTICVITSVAGERGRQSNYVYGSAKGMVSLFLQGLRNRLYKSNVQVIDIKPGFVDTPMTENFSKGVLWSDPDKIAQCIYRAISKGKHSCYAPWFWRFIMMVIKLIPEPMFKKLNL